MFNPIESISARSWLGVHFRDGILWTVFIWYSYCCLRMWPICEQRIWRNRRRNWSLRLVFVSTRTATNATDNFDGDSKANSTQLLWQYFTSSGTFQEGSFRLNVLCCSLISHVLMNNFRFLQIIKGAFSYFMTMRQFIKWSVMGCATKSLNRYIHIK